MDSSLRRLLDSNDVSCKLFLAYLHARTSYCLPDPATLPTGTEQAFTILRSKAVESSSQLSQENVNVLAKIAELRPGRPCYPSNKRVVQSVQWDVNLPSLSQHDDFHKVVAGLLRQSERSKRFYPEMKIQITHRKDVDEHLRARASMRSSIFQISGFGAENHESCDDEVYKPRDQGLQSHRATNVATISALVFREGEARHWDAAQQYTLWSSMCDQKIIHGAQTKFDTSLLRFDAPLLEKDVIGTILAKLPALHQSFKNPQTLEKYRFSFMVWVCTMSFASDAQLDKLRFIVMRVKSRQLALVQAPSSASFRAYRGRLFQDNNIKKILNENLRSMYESPEWKITRQKNEKSRDYDRRRQSAWTRAKNTFVDQIMSSLKSQWPDATPVYPQMTNVSTYINIDRAMPRIKEEVNAWYDNSLLHNYVSQLTQACLLVG